MSENIIDSLRQFILDESGLNDIDFVEDDTDLIEAGVLDSLLMVMLVDFCENEFNCEIDLNNLTDDNFQSLNAIADFVKAMITR